MNISHFYHTKLLTGTETCRYESLRIFPVIGLCSLKEVLSILTY